MNRGKLNRSVPDRSGLADSVTLPEPSVLPVATSLNVGSSGPNTLSLMPPANCNDVPAPPSAGAPGSRLLNLAVTLTDSPAPMLAGTELTWIAGRVEKNRVGRGRVGQQPLLQVRQRQVVHERQRALAR